MIAIFYRIQYWFHKHLSRPWRRIGVVLNYFPILWHDHDFDYFYLYKILYKKLSRMHIAIRDGHAANAARTAESIKLCCLLLERLMNDQYDNVLRSQHDKKWGESDLKFDEGKLTITRKNVTTPEEENKANEESLAISKYEAKQRSQDLDLLFTTMKKHIQGWWD